MFQTKKFQDWSFPIFGVSTYTEAKMHACMYIYIKQSPVCVYIEAQERRLNEEAEDLAALAGHGHS